MLMHNSDHVNKVILILDEDITADNELTHVVNVWRDLRARYLIASVASV